MADLMSELDKTIALAKAAEQAAEAKAALGATDQALKDGTATVAQVKAAIEAHEAVADFRGGARYKLALARLASVRH